MINGNFSLMHETCYFAYQNNFAYNFKVVLDAIPEEGIVFQPGMYIV